MTNFEWIKSEIEAKKLLEYFDREIQFIRNSPFKQNAEVILVKFINNRDEVLDLCIKRKYKIS